jgi:hypothetical protein
MNSLERNLPNGLLLWCYLHPTAGLVKAGAPIRVNLEPAVEVRSEE